ncbi:MAG: caspase family protein, partial [Candidatus Obscuribacterales bacterium]|nr:caspase family protein [Candidatus Obscuribacterales bacterium]
MLSILRRVRESAVWIAAAAALAISLGGQLAFAEETKKPPAFKDKWALVVGVSEFSDESLNGSDNRGAANAKSFAEVLTSRLNFAPDHVKVLTDKDANRNDIMLLMCDRWLNQVAGPQDLALIFIATKGTASELDLTGTNYLLAHDSQKEALYASGIAMSGVLSMLRDRLFAKS